MRLHSIVGVITNSSSEMFPVLKNDALTLVRNTIKALDMEDTVSVFALVIAGYDEKRKEFICHTDEELASANAYLIEHEYPEKSEIHIVLKSNGTDLDLAKLFTNLTEDRWMMQ